MNQKAPAPVNRKPFPIMLSFMLGLQTIWGNRAVLARLLAFPFIVTFITLSVARALSGFITPFWVAILQLPASFVIGMALVIILRWVMLNEHPAVPLLKGSERLHPMRGAAAVFMTVVYLQTGLQAVYMPGSPAVTAMNDMQNDMSSLAMWVGVSFVILMLWISRYLWLFIPVALDWKVGPFFDRLGGFFGSAHVFALMALSGFSMLVVMMVCSSLIGAVFSGGGMVKGSLTDLMNAAFTVMGYVLFTSSSIHAIRFMTVDKKV